ncbi:hypothetical protein CC79DRAFT_1336828 [Sarocladium strictum]
MASVAAAAASFAAPPPQLSAPGSVTPAQLGFLAIYNPSLGNTDDTIDDQIVYYTSVTTQNDNPRKNRRARGRPTEDVSQEERHERLRQIGLAQGMVHFGKDFADGASVDAIDTEKTRVVLHELEPGWWILASIDLTKIPLPPRLPTKSGETHDERFEYSTKEMKPASLILRDLVRAHSLFLMHHDSSLSALFVRSKRSKFVAVLSRYWDLFLSTWNVMLHGNPIRGVLGGINVAGSGELGIGVGEEERGSGEREVLEGLVGRIEGLVDLVVSKFEEEEPAAGEGEPASTSQQQWLGTGQEPSAADGAIFLGTGALSRKSLRDITHWMEDLYTWGEHAYGVIDSPTSTRRHKKGRHVSRQVEANAQENPAPEEGNPNVAVPRGDEETPGASKTQDEDDGKLDKMVSYLKLGYGTYWSLPGGGSDGQPDQQQPTTNSTSAPETKQSTLQIEPSVAEGRPGMARRTSSHDSAAHYLIGLRGDIEEQASEQEPEHDLDDPDADHNSRTVVRTINVELEREALDRPEATIVRDFEHPGSILTQSQVIGNMLPGYDSHDLNKAMKLRVVVYVNRPFIFAFLFELRTDSLAWDALYRSLHYQLAPLRKPLLASTKFRPERPAAGPAASSINDLVWDPVDLTVHSTIPNIPEQYTPQDTWSRADALSTHLHLLNLHGATRDKLTDLERTQKTNRGWWIVWTRLMEKSTGDPSANLSTIKETASDTETYSRAGTAEEEDQGPQVEKEIFLIRRASDHARFRSEGGNDGAGKLAQGIGVDTRRYVEELLNLL